ncbi:MAG TPA: tRNA pseudouridine(55) synthase TruB [Pirellulaceae bacterium]
MFGFLNVDKPGGMTSRDVVNRVERLVRPAKCGHAGTLDPLATGVLVVGVGQATRLMEHVHRLSKTYQGTFLLGRQSDTEDIEGEVEELALPPVPSNAALEAAAQRFVGTIQQRPPAYSAIKVEGKRAYKMARRGESIELAARPVEIYLLQVVRYEYPELELFVRCGSGTYVRSLGRDLAASLGTAAVMSQLRRLAIGPFRVEEAVEFDDLSREVIESRLLSPLMGLEGMPRVEVSEEEVRRLVNGQVLANRWSIDAQEAAAMAGDGRLVAILQPKNGGLAPVKCFMHG